MEIIAATGEGFLIQASESEIEEILRAVSGKAPEKLSIGQRIPAIDYASTITKIKELEKNTEYTYMLERIERFNVVVSALKESVQKASTIEI